MDKITGLINQALKAREMSYCKYSGFAVGAAVLTKSGKIFTGCNIENSSYPVSCCAERTALYKAISEGFTDIESIVVVGGLFKQDPTEYVAPCGMCRQALLEFGADIIVYCAKTSNDYIKYRLSDILPFGFLL